MNPQVKKSVPLILVFALIGLVFIIRQCGQDRVQRSDMDVSRKETRRNDASAVNRDRGFDRRISYLEYSNHAKCRMDCRKISQTEVEEIMQDGKINYGKSDLQNSRCPRYAVEGKTNDDQQVRIVFAQCNEKTTVVTVIDLETEWACDCSGDDRKFESKN